MLMLPSPHVARTCQYFGGHYSFFTAPPLIAFMKPSCFHMFSIRLILNGGNAGRFWVLTTTLEMGWCIRKDLPFDAPNRCIVLGWGAQPTNKKNCHPDVSFQEVSIQKHKLPTNIFCFLREDIRTHKVFWRGCRVPSISKPVRYW